MTQEQKIRHVFRLWGEFVPLKQIAAELRLSRRVVEWWTLPVRLRLQKRRVKKVILRASVG